MTDDDAPDGPPDFSRFCTGSAGDFKFAAPKPTPLPQEPPRDTD